MVHPVEVEGLQPQALGGKFCGATKEFGDPLWEGAVMIEKQQRFAPKPVRNP